MDQYFNLIFLMKNILSLALQVVQTEGYGMLTNDGQITVQNKRQTKDKLKTQFSQTLV